MPANIYLILNFFAIITTCSSKLNVPRVLMPLIKNTPIVFTLESSDGGCYQWHVPENPVISIEPIDVDPDLHCSKKAMVKAIPKSIQKSIAIITAEDVTSRQIVRCDVIVDVINSLAISTTTRELFIDDAPEAFEVRAFDCQGNSFTTLEGVQFDWTITGLGPSKEGTMLKLLKFKDSSYETPPSIAKMEEEDKRGHIVLLEGVKTGSAKVSVRLPYRQYNTLNLAQAKLVVIANLIITPSEVNLMVGDEVQLQITQVRYGKHETVTLPHKQYYFKTDPAECALVKSDGILKAMRKGPCQILLLDRNINENDPSLKLPTATVKVVEAHKVFLTTLPHHNLAVLVSENIDIALEVLSKNNRLIHLGPNVQGVIQVGEIFHVHERTKNGTWLTGWAIKEGKGRIKAQIKGTDMETVNIATITTLEVYPRIVISPSQVVFPWDSDNQPKFEIQLNATGGDGLFLWSSSNHSIGVVTQTGFVRTHSEGYFEISASMQRNHNNRQYTRFFIIPPSRLEISEFIMEAEVGTPVYLHIALYADIPSQKKSKDSSSNQVPVTHCQDLDFKVQMSNQNFAYNRSDVIKTVGTSCANVALVGLRPGSTLVSVFYTKDGRKLEDSVTITAFDPLKLLHPQGDVILAVGCSVLMVFSGGPPVPKDRPSNHKRIVITNNKDIAKGEDVTGSVKGGGGTIVRVTCRRLGETNVTLSVVNMPTLPNCKYHETCTSVKIICAKPEKLQLQPAIKIGDSNQCPINVNPNRMLAYSGKDIQVDVKVFDSLGRSFLDASSLLFQWSLKPNDFGKIGNPNGIFTQNRLESGVPYVENNYQVIKPLSKKGEVELTARVVGYKKEALSKSKASSESGENNKELLLPSMKATTQIIFVDNIVVTPTELSIYNNPAIKKTISVKEGSGYYKLKMSSDDVALIKYNEAEKEIEVTPRKEGETQIEVVDLCLPFKSPVVNVKVTSVHIIRVEMSDKVEVGRCIPCTVKFYDEADNLLALPDIASIDIKVVLSKHIVKVRRLTDEKAKDSGEAHYIVTGLELGNADLLFSVKSGEKDVQSAPIELVVFAPLKISPRNATLLIGSKFQFTAKGGPQPDCIIEYKIEDSKTANIDEFGIIVGQKYGTTDVIARAIGVNPTTGLKVVYSEDKVTAEVIALTGIKIAAPLTRFVRGSAVPVWVTGLPEKISASILASVEPPIRFQWTVDDSETVKIYGVFDSLGINYDLEDNISVRLKGIRPGSTLLRLIAFVCGTVLNKPRQPNVIFKSQLNIEIFESLDLNLPEKSQGKPLLMAPFSSITVSSNLDGLLKVKYSVSSVSGPSSEEKDKSEKPASYPSPVVSVSDTGVVTSTNKLGRALIVIQATDSEGLTQYRPLIIEVKPIHYMMLVVDTKWEVKDKRPMSTIPLGTEIILKAIYCDSSGSEFTSGSLQLKARSSRLDLVKLSPGCTNDTMLVSTKKRGSSVIKVWGEGYRRTADYVKLHVEQSIAPSLEKLTTGDILCLQCPLRPNKCGMEGKWSVSEKCLQVLDATKGLFRVTATSDREIFIMHDLHKSSPIKISIEPPEVIRTFEDTKKYVTNTPLLKPYSIPLAFGSKSCPERINNMFMGWDCKEEVAKVVQDFPHKCHLKYTNENSSESRKNILKIHPGFDPKRGQYLCLISPGVENSKEISVLSTDLIVWAELPGSKLKSNPVELKFLPGIHIKEELIIKDKYFGILNIHGLNSVLEHVKVEANDPSILSVPRPQSPTENKLNLKIQLIDYHWKFEELKEPMIVKIVSPLTSQNIKVVVKVDKSVLPTCGATSQGPLSNLIGSNFGFILISTVIILLISLYVYINHMQPVINVNLSRRSLLAEKYSSLKQENSTCEEPSSFKRSATIPFHIPTRLACTPGCTAICNRNNLISQRHICDSPNALSPPIRRTKRFI